MARLPALRLPRVPRHGSHRARTLRAVRAIFSAWRVHCAWCRWRDEIFKLDGIGGSLRGRAWRQGDGARAALIQWVDGRTGYPFVDAFMRELRATGYTTHCGRECACWFLVRDLGVDWRLGAEYFEHVLIDYEPSANWGNWAYRIATTTPPRLMQPDEETRSTGS
jgi:deoxyribodipyrimidine photo-lyase